MSTAGPDRAAALRDAVRTAVAERGLHGASVSHIARLAGVATGTAYVHYADKDDLVLAAYVEAKQALGDAAVAVARAAPAADHRGRFVALWRGAYDHLRRDPAVAGFLVQVDASPLAGAAHERVASASPDALLAEVTTSGLRDVLLDLDDTLLYELALAPAVRLAARPEPLDDDALDTLANACFTAASKRTDLTDRTASARSLSRDDPRSHAAQH